MMLSLYAILLPSREWISLKTATVIVQNQDGQEPFKKKSKALPINKFGIV